MTERQPAGHRESPDTVDPNSPDNLVDGRTGENVADRGRRDTELTTDDAAQRENGVERPCNEGS